MCQESNWIQTDTFGPASAREDWLCHAAAELLAASGDQGVVALEAGFYRRQGPSVSWLICGLGRSRSPKALKALETLLRAQPDRNYQNVVYAVSMHGSAGHELLTRVGGPALANSAKDMRLPRSWPRPKSGSLPKRLGE